MNSDGGIPETRGEFGATQVNSERGERRKWQALAICLVAGFMTLLDVSIVNIALPSIQHGVQASPVALAWVVSGYALTFGLVLVPAGRIGDDRGRSRMFVFALAVFTAASTLAGFAQNALWLVIARLLQGAAGGLLNPQVLGLMQHLFHGRQRGRAFGLFGAVVGLSTAVGPLLGGTIIEFAGDEHGWRWVFFVNLPIGLIALAFALKVLPPDFRRTPLRNLDLMGVLLLGTGLLSLLLPMVERGNGSGSPWQLVLVSPVLLVLFVYWEHRYRQRGHAPLVNFRLLRIRSYSFGTTLGLLYFAGFTGIFLVLAVYFQRGLGYTALEAGMALTPFAVGSAVSSAWGGRIVHRFGRKLVIIGLVGSLAGLVATDVLLWAHFGSAAGWVTALPLLVAGGGSGLVIAPNQTVTLSEVESTHGGTAAGVQQTGQRIGSAIGTAAASGLFFGSLTGGDYEAAISAGLVASVGFVAAALILGLVELALSSPRKEAR